MDSNSAAAETLVHMTLDGAERALRITGRGAEYIISVIYRALRERKDEKEPAGKQKLEKLLSSGERLDIYEVPQERIKDFSKRAQKFGIPFSIIKVGEIDSESIEVISKERHSSIIQRILYELQLDPEEIKVAGIKEEKKETEKAGIGKGIENILGREYEGINPPPARTEEVSVPFSQNTRMRFTDSDHSMERRPSVRHALRSFCGKIKKAERAEGIDESPAHPDGALPYRDGMNEISR